MLGGITMRKIILFSSMLLLLAVGAGAQSNSDSDGEGKTASNKMTVEGCVDGAIGNYTLTDPAGASYRLTGNTDTLKAHVGATIQVLGVVTPVMHVPGAMSEGTETQPTLSVISFTRISAVCGDTNKIP
jgi:hypothetical protein